MSTRSRETIAATVKTYDFDYDGASRLERAAYPADLGLPSAPELFDYDRAGNRDDDPSDPLPWRYDDNNRIEASPGSPLDVAYGFDADGNLTSRNGGARSLTWDATDQLRQVVDSATGTSTYKYDPFGRRIQKTTGGATTYYVWDGDQLLAEYSSTGTRQVRYAYAQGFTPAQAAYVNGSSENVYDVHSDHLDTPKLLTGASAAPVWRASHEAFGKAALAPGNAETFNLRFPGQYYDAETGLHYNRFRYYDPGVGRYISADPIGQFGLQSLGGPLRQTAGSNTFAYALSNPLQLIDPLGLYGTGSCDYYSGRCDASGGDYYCSIAPFFCDLFPDPGDPDPTRDDDFEGWSRCTRKCLQDCDADQNADQNMCPAEPDSRTNDFTDPGATECHIGCYGTCYGNHLLGRDYN